MKKDIVGEATQVVKSIIVRIIKSISIIAIFLLLAMVIFTSMGAEFSLKAFLTSGFGVSSILLSIGSIFLYELWLRNGQNSGREEKDYIGVTEEFQKKSKNMSPDHMQMFIEAEKQRRYEVEEKKILKEIEHIDQVLKKTNLSERARKKLSKRRQTLVDHVIIVKMPYRVSEEIESLRYSLGDDKKKEYKPSDIKNYLRFHRASKYFLTTFLAMFSVNLIIMGGLTGNWWNVLLTFFVAVIVIIISVVTGFSNGYHSMAITAVGVYKTGNEFIDKAVNWCTKKGFSLYYAEEKKEKSYQKTKFLIPYLVDEPDDYYRPTLVEVFGRPEVIIE